MSSYACICQNCENLDGVGQWVRGVPSPSEGCCSGHGPPPPDPPAPGHPPCRGQEQQEEEEGVQEVAGVSVSQQLAQLEEQTCQRCVMRPGLSMPQCG